jgi:hypothetical protein
MKLEDYLEPEVGVAVAVTAAAAALASPRLRKTLRTGAVYGLAGLMMAGDRVAALAGNARDAARGAGEGAGAGAGEPPSTPAPAT